MSLKVRSILVVVVGTVLGLTVSIGNGFLVARQARQAGAPRIDTGSDLIAEVLADVRREYVDQIDEEKLVAAAIRGIVSELDDHSRYLDQREYEEIRISTTGNYSGVGLDVSLEAGQLKVVAPLDGAPAYQAGIQPGDVLVSVDDVPVSEGNVEETVSRMRGEPGTPVTLGVIRSGAETPLRFALTRAEIVVKTVQSAYLGNGYGYLRLSGFSDTTAGDLAQAIKELKAAAQPELRGAVLDLRNNPGGVLDAAVDVADTFLDRGLIVRGAGRARESRFARYARAGDLLADIPLAVLVNAGSASASEIVAGALQDHARARIVGQRTYGKGSVQTVMPLGGGRAIKLTTSRYVTPSGRSINGRGVKPDVVVDSDEAQRTYRGPGSRFAAGDDLQLQAALQTLGYTPIKLSSAQ